MEGIATGGPDVVLRIGVNGFRLGEHERVLDVYGDRVLSGEGAPGQGVSRLIVRDLDGTILREIHSVMQIPHEAIVRGDDVYFAGIDLHEDADGFPVVTDRGAWVARGDNSPEPLIAPIAEQVRYQSIHRSPDGRSVGITRCGEEACITYLVGPDGNVTEVPKTLLLITMTNDAAVLIGAFSDITAFAITDGRELWHAETDGIYGARYPTSDGRRIVNSSIEDAGDGDGNSQDQLRIEVIDAQSGHAEQTVLVPAERSPTPWVVPSLSTDRYAALVDSIVPNPEEGPHAVRIVDLQAGDLLDVELQLGDVP